MSKEELYNIVFDTPELKEYVENKDKEIERLNNIINEANRVLGETLIKYEDGVFRPIKNTSKQDVYKVVCKLYGILGTTAIEGYKE